MKIQKINSMERYDCPKCKDKSVFVSVEEKNDCIETSIFKCLNRSCNHQVMSINELTKPK